MKLKRLGVVSMLVTALMLCSCGKEEKTTFTGDKVKQPEYQGSLNMISNSAYSTVQGLQLEPGTYISVIGKESDSAYWRTVEKGVMQAAEDLNKELGYTGSDKIKVTYNAPATKEDIDEQVNILDEELARYPDVIALASIYEDAYEVQLDLAVENGISIISFDSGNIYPGIQCIIKTNNESAAETGAYKLADAMGKKGNILLLVHDSKSESAKERVAGFIDYITNSKFELNLARTVYADDFETEKKKILENEIAEAEKANPEAQTTEEQAEEQPEDQTEAEASPEEKAKELGIDLKLETEADILQYYIEKDQITGVFATNGTTLQMAAEAVKKVDTENDEKIYVMGFDTSEEQINDMKNGVIDGIVAQNPFGIGYATVVAAARTAQRSGNEAVVDTGYMWITAKNIDDESIKKLIYQ